MGLLDICSNNSYWRGLDYFENKHVKTINQINRYEYDADVEGSEIYHVHLDINHPRKSTCTCPHASGKSTICKHKVAVYFSIFPEEAEEAIEERKRYYEELEERERKYDRKVEKITKQYEEYVNTLPIEQIKRMLVNYMVDSYMENEDDPYKEEEYYNY